jgi:DNA adenine methylase
MWAGGKTKLLNKYEPHLPEKFVSYHEPFFGGGAMFIWAYHKNPNADFYINDINPHIIEIYKAIRDDVGTFCSIVDEYEKKYLSLDPPKQKIKEDGKTKWVDHPTGAKDKELEKEHKLPGNKYNWHEIYAIKPTRRSFFFKTRQAYQEDYKGWSTTEEAAILYFLMKTAFNGVWQVGKGHGRFNTPCGLMRQDEKIYDKKNVMKWHEALQGCHIQCGDFQSTLGDIGPGSYTFLDPPYRSASSEEQTFADYGTELGDDFQEKVLDFFHHAGNLGSKTLLSNRDWGDGFFENRRRDAEIEYFDVTYTVGRKKEIENSKHEAKSAREILLMKG